MTFDTKRFYLARFGSEKSITFARSNAEVVYIVLKKMRKKLAYICICQKFFVPLRRLLEDAQNIETYQRINLIDKSGRFICVQGG